MLLFKHVHTHTKCFPRGLFCCTILFRVLYPNSSSTSKNDERFRFIPHFFLASYDIRNLYRERKKREEKRSQLYLSRVDLSHRIGWWSRVVCFCLFCLKENERKREIFDPQRHLLKAIIKRTNNDDDKRAPMPAKRRDGCKQQTIKREQQQMQQQE